MASGGGAAHQLRRVTGPDTRGLCQQKGKSLPCSVISK